MSGGPTKRVISFLSQSFFTNNVYTARNGLARGMKRRGGLGFVPQISELTKEEKFLLEKDFHGMVVYDVGAFVGITTLFFSRAVGGKGKVVAFEPNAENYGRLGENLRLNGCPNVEAFNMALGRRKERGELWFEEGKLSGGSVGKRAEKPGGRDGTTLKMSEVNIDSLDNQLKEEGRPEPDFIKIDVEGFEGEVLEGARNVLRSCRPELFIEIHGIDEKEKKENVQRVATLLAGEGYEMVHVESGRPVSPDDCAVAMRGHLYCRHPRGDSPGVRTP